MAASAPIKADLDLDERGIPLRLPVQSWDALLHLSHLHGQYPHLVIELDLEVEGHLDAALLANAVDQELDVQPVLGCRFVAQPRIACWQRVPLPERKVFSVVESLEDFDAFRHCGLDPEHGVQLGVCLFAGASSDHVSFKMSHQVGDAVAIRDAVYQIAEIYSALCASPSYLHPRNQTGHRGLGQVRQSLPWRAYPRIALNMARQFRDFSAQALALPFPQGPTLPWAYVKREIRAEDAAALGAFARRHGATLNDLMIAAFFQAAAGHGRWDGHGGVSVLTTIDLRRYLRRRDVGVVNLSAVEVLRLPDGPGNDFVATLARVVKRTGNSRRQWPGLTALPLFLGVQLMLQCFGFARMAVPPKPLPARRTIQMFSNAGSIEGDRLTFGSHLPLAASLLPMPARLPMIFIGVSSFYPHRRGLRGEGTVTISVAAPDVARAEISTFLDEMIDALSHAV